MLAAGSSSAHLGHARGVGEGNVGLVQPQSSAGCGPSPSRAGESLLRLPWWEGSAGPGCSSLTLPGARVIALGQFGHGEATGRPPGGAGQAEPQLQHVPRLQCTPLPGPLCPRHLP